MRSSIMLVSALAMVAFGSPVEKRATSSHSELANVKRFAAMLSGPPVAQGYASNGYATVKASPTLNSSSTSDITGTASSQSQEATSILVATPDTLSVAEVEQRAAKPPPATYYREAATRRHNLHRANHGSGPMVWDADLERAAMKSAQRCTFAHYMGENGLTYGQNLAIGNAAPDIAGIITDQWYIEESKYRPYYGMAQPDYGYNMEKFEQYGHFTQLVWKSSTKLGCATWRCKSVKTSKTNSTPMPATYGGDVTYCNYEAPGNYGGEYAANIGKPKSTVKVASGYNVNMTAIAISYSKWTGQKW